MIFQLFLALDGYTIIQCTSSMYMFLFVCEVELVSNLSHVIIIWYLLQITMLR